MGKLNLVVIAVGMSAAFIFHNFINTSADWVIAAFILFGVAYLLPDKATLDAACRVFPDEKMKSLKAMVDWVWKSDKR